MNKLTAYLHVRLLQMERDQPRKRRARTGRQAGWGIAAILLAGLVAGGVILQQSFAHLTASLPDVGALPTLLNPDSGRFLTPTRVYDRTGQVLLGEVSLPGIPRRFLHLESANGDAFSADLVNATVAAVDPSFWSNPGYVLTGLDQPDSHPTIAQSLVYQLFLSHEPPTRERAVRERILAGEVTRQYGRKQVLEWYLNSVSYGRQAYGAEAAARLYFGKSASQLNLAESTLLAAVSSAPALNPLDAPAAAKTLQVETLRRMSSSSMVAERDILSALSTPLSFASPPVDERPNQALIDLALEQAAEKIGQQPLERGGYQIFTTIDAALQSQTECGLQAQVTRLTGGSAGATACETASLLPILPPTVQYPAGSLTAEAVVLDPATGVVLAYSAPSPEGPVSHLPGSILTPFVYLAGYSSGITPGTLYWDIPARMPAGLADLPSPDRRFHGPQRQRVALVNDYLGHTAQIENQAGVDRLNQVYRLFGLDAGSPDSVTLLRLPWLGGSLSLLDVSQAYATLANQGSATGYFPQNSSTPAANILQRVLDGSGQVLLERSTPETRPLTSSALAYLINDMLADEDARQPLEASTGPLETSVPAALKVGQTAYGKDTWVVGYTPPRLAGIWMGLNAQIAPNLTLSPRGAAGLWTAIFQEANRGLDFSGWPVPDGISTVTICDPGGELPGADCPRTARENFLEGTQPVTQDTLYRSVQVNRETGRLATVFTPPELVESQPFLTVPADALEWAEQQGIDLPPDSWDVVQKPVAQPGAHFTRPEMFAPVRGKVDLTGTAGGAEFKEYRLQAGQGLNPQEWIQIGSSGSTPVSEGLLGTWDTSGLSGLYAIQLQVIRQDQQVTSAVIQVTVDNQPPQLNLVYPAAKEEISSREGWVSFLVSVSDDTRMDRVEYWVDGTLQASSTASPYTGLWKATGGKHRLLVKACDSAGNESQTVEISFSVR